MSNLFSTEGLTKSQQRAIVDALTIQSETKKRGKIIYGPKMRCFDVSENKKWISVPMTIGRTLFTDRLPVDTTEWSTRCPHLIYKGTLRPYQVSAMEEAMQHLTQHRTTLLACFPGFGKTRCAAFLVVQPLLQLKTIIVLESTTLIPNWVTAFEDCTNCKIIVLDRSTPSSDIDSADVVVCMNERFNYMTSAQQRSFGVLILEEAHLLCTPTTLPVLLHIYPQFVISCTATPDREDSLDRILTFIGGTHRVVRKNEKPFDVFRVNTQVEPLVVKSDEQGTNWTLVLYSLAFNESRNWCILETVLANQAEHKIMILTALEVHVELIYQLLKHYGVDVSRYAGKQTTYTNARVLVSTTGKASVGFDEESNKTYDKIRIDLLIDVSSTRKVAGHEQKSGRALRADFPNIIKFVDQNNNIKSHYRIEEKWYVNNRGVIQGEINWSTQPRTISYDDFHSVHDTIYQHMLELLQQKEKKTSKPNLWLIHVKKTNS